ncbi:hypothetical protein [Victivallis lenta]|uniref:hypothetical protein n=1 Tax=Victivallis lenta TaxID=2606640 RepID=UPI002353CA9D|nr:hypothetical protein [Victivallis lenta]
MNESPGNGLLSSEQLIYLEFNGGDNLSYRGELLSLDGISVESSGLSAGRIDRLVNRLNSAFSARGIRFVTNRPELDAYSTIHVGKTDAFTPFGNFTGLSETVDTGNRNRNDNAFVLLDGTSSDDELFDAIGHETGHLVGDAHAETNGTLFDYALDNSEYDNQTVLSGATLTIPDGVTGHGNRVESGGTIVVGIGGTAQNTTLSGGFFGSETATQNVSGGTASNTVVGYRGFEYIQSGGVASGTLVQSGGSQCAASGGTAYGTIVSGGFLSAYGGAISGAVIHDGSGQIFGTVQDMTLHSGYVWFQTGCIADGVTVSGGRVETSNAEIHNLTIHSGGTGTIGAGTLYDTKLLGGNVSIFHVEQTDFHRMTISGGTALIESRTALRDTVLQDGVLNLRNISGSGNGAFDTIVEGGSMVLSSGAVAAGTVLSGGSMVLLEGAAATGTILRGGSQILAGAAENGAVLSGGTQFVSSGIAVSDTRLSGGSQIVSSGGSAVNTVIDHGVQVVKSGGIASNTTLNNGSLNIQSGGLLRDGSINNRALLSLASGAELGGVIRVAGFLAAHGAVTVQSGGRIDLQLEGRSPAASSIINSIGNITAATSGGLRITVTESMIAAGGSFRIADGADGYTGQIDLYLGTRQLQSFVWDERQLGGYTAVFRHAGSEGSSVYLLKNQNSTLVFTLRDSFSDLVIGSGGDTMNHYFGNGEHGSGNRITEGGVVNVYSGGTADGTEIAAGGTMLISSGGTVSNTRILSGGYQYLQGIADGTEVASGGMFMAGSGAAMTGVNLENGAIWGLDFNTQIAGTSNGSAFSYETTSNSYNLHLCGGKSYQLVSSGQNAVGTVIGSGGRMQLGTYGSATSPQATATDTVIESGGVMTVYGNSVLAGRTELAGSMTVTGAGVTIADGGVISIDLRKQTPEAYTYMITGLGYITGGSYEIRTSYNQAAGVYRLAARTMNQEIPVMTLKAQGLNRGGGSVALTDRILYIDFDYGYGICSDKNRDMTLSFVKTAQSGQTVGAAVQNRFDQILVQSGAAATGLTAEAGGTIMMGERTRLNTVFLTGGTMQVLGAVTMTAGGLLSIDVSGYAADTDTVMIDNLAAIAGASLTLAAGATPAFGSYKLAGNAADFTGTVTAASFLSGNFVWNGTGYNTLADAAGNYYDLARNAADELVLTVSAAYAPPADWGSATIVSLLSTGADVSSLADHGGFIADGNVSVVCDASYAGKVLHGGPGTGDFAGNVWLVLKHEAGTMFGGGDNRAMTGTVNLTAEAGTRIYNLFGGGDNASTGAVNLEFRDGNANYLYGGGLRGNVNGDIGIAMRSGSVWKLFGGGAEGDVTGNISLDLSGGGITSVLYGGGIGSVTGDIVLNIGSGVDFSARPNIYGGTLNGYTGALNSTKGGQAAVTAAGTGSTVTGSITMNLTGASLFGLVHGGSYNSSVAALVSRVTNDITINVSGATHQAGSTGWLFGGGFANGAGAQDYVGGTCSVNVSGGSDLNYVLGGGRAEKGGTANAGGVNISISGGIFRKRLHGGGFANSSGSTAQVLGDVSITVDTSQDRTTFLDAVYAGGYALDGANADVSGGARVTFTGSGANLTFDGNLYGTGRSSGGNASAVVAGISTLAFTDYTGDFNAAVRNFDAIEFSGGTSVTLTKREADAAVNSYTFNLSGRNSSELSTAMVSRLSGSWNFTGASAARIIDLGDGALFTGSGSLLLVDATPELLNFADDGGFTLRYGADSDTLFAGAASWTAFRDREWKLGIDNGQLSLHWQPADTEAPPAAAAYLSESEELKRSGGSLAVLPA